MDVDNLNLVKITHILNKSQLNPQFNTYFTQVNAGQTMDINTQHESCQQCTSPHGQPDDIVVSVLDFDLISNLEFLLVVCIYGFNSSSLLS